MTTPARPDAVSGKSNRGRELDLLRALERKVLWLSTWMIHHANHLRPNRDGLKVGGHQASSASLATLMTALYFQVLRPADRVAVKPHASPVFHAIQYLLGRQSRDKLIDFRALGGAQSYPSRTKDIDEVDFSTGSVGLGVAMTAFASLVQDYVSMKGWLGEKPPLGRMVALMGDAELDEGNIFEAMLEGWKHDIRNTWWVVDYNRQSLDSVIADRLFARVDDIFRTTGWRVITLKYGYMLQSVFEQTDGEALRQWIDDCPNSLYSALTYKGGPGWREHLRRDLGDVPGLRPIIEDYDDAALHDLMTNLAGHDMAAVLDCFDGVEGDEPTCFIAYTVKGKELPLAGHKDNHAGLMSPEQMAEFQARMGIADGQEWEPFAGLAAEPEELRAFLGEVPFSDGEPRRRQAPRIALPAELPPPDGGREISTQEAFGRILFEIAGQDDDFARRIVTASPDVTVSTNLGGWVNRRGIFDRHPREDIFREEKVVSAQRWAMHPDGQHIELGIAENNLFLTLAALGLSASLFGQRLLPIGTLYDPFISRGLDALNYACYQDARFMLVGTPSGITLAPEGGAHQSLVTPLIGIGQDKMSGFEPAFVDELAVIMRWGFEHMQAEDGGSVYLRLTTRAVAQPERAMNHALREQILAGAYWLVPPRTGADLAIVCCGAVVPEAIAAHQDILPDIPGAGLLVVTSPDLAYRDWNHAWRQRARGRYEARSHIGRLLDPLARDAALVTVIDGHPSALSWLGSASRRRVFSLGVENFGESGDIDDLYRVHGIDREAILDACAAACLSR
ncbi:MAG: transketolase [Alphaproteobacteria bacterium]|jgi:pyruvate dehydrogenase E1 component|nr:transketolase [Alphaproteobacteria bacterium]MDP6814214.1 transketolase [Alphaproteobacteria bacterium]